MKVGREKWISLLGLAARARELVSGEELVINDIRRKNVYLVLISADASAATAKKIQDKCQHYDIPYKVGADRFVLGSAIGKAERVVIGVKSKGFAGKISDLMDQ
ncbi:YlxQ family RNA-binding protein [Alkalicoccobacillus porphyridii]|uniref:YlxQ family RNA-binding protein n=1 Tax=Alkalicoccobacillus porphyridii TaxID=2597270 RepID=A0A553ZYG2_9BACI|nr:YlxQ family RNA-binding protein [Alkalicoccobacillus porphyridii]TSB46445.1 YlxQ family RNA-binding protein [Alkalicoccobacillus porphyridii]